MRTVVAFDFDGTLTTRDTFPAFIRFSLGFWRFAVGLALFAPMLVAMKGGFYPNWKAKQRVFSHFFKGMSVGRFDAYCEDFCRDRLPRMLRKQLLQTVREYTGGKYELCVVSASIDRRIHPAAVYRGRNRERRTDRTVLYTELLWHRKGEAAAIGISRPEGVPSDCIWRQPRRQRDAFLRR